MPPLLTPPVTRFAPSPTGYLHIGGARTALFNYLFARHHGGSFRLRIEDTDQARSSQAAVDAILEGLDWLNLAWDGAVVYQSKRVQRHAEVAHALVTQGGAYFCYATQQELDDMREAQRAAGLPIKYDGRWRDRNAREAPAGAKPVVRLKAPQSGSTTITDLVQGAVTVENAILDDMILLRSDGTPTYMLSVVVDDYDMGVTHVIRGDDHLNNAFRQLALIRALGWPEPYYAHIPLIHGADGAKLSKRHGALAVGEYAQMGYLPEAMENALLRLGWGHGDAEIITRAQAIAWFDLNAVGKSAARFDIKKLDHLNGHYLRHADDQRLASLIQTLLERQIGRTLQPGEQTTLVDAMHVLKMRAKTTLDLSLSAQFLFQKRPIAIDDAARRALNTQALELLKALLPHIEQASAWDTLTLGFAKIAQPLRAALTGSTTSPGIADVMVLLGRFETRERIADALTSV
jgi:glutamyl-tRNA synthetase